MELIDTHAHLNFTDYASDFNEIIENSQKMGISIINVGTNYNSSKRAVELAESYPAGVFAAIGLHPSNIRGDTSKPDPDKPEDVAEPDFDAEIYGRLCSSKKVVAVGEIGLDNFRLPKSKTKANIIKEKQLDVFLKQVGFARAQKLPVVIHCRNAHDEMIDILARDFSKNGPVEGVIHCFTATKEQAEKYYNLGFYFGLNGILFKADLNEAVAAMPLDRILLETDCPFLAPPRQQARFALRATRQGRGSPLQEGVADEPARNTPLNLPIIANRVAQIRNDSVDTIIDSCTNNARKLFGI